MMVVPASQVLAGPQFLVLPSCRLRQEAQGIGSGRVPGSATALPHALHRESIQLQSWSASTPDAAVLAR